MNFRSLLLSIAVASLAGCISTPNSVKDWSLENPAEVKQAAEKGNALAQYNLGLMYDDGQGITQDDKQAVHWYRQAAEQGNALAQFNLGNMYFNGRGVAQDDKKAAYWYQQAAKQQVAGAQFFLGNMYADGRGVKKDHEQAVYWYRKAAELGGSIAQNSLGVMYSTGSGVEQDFRQAYAWFSAAAANDYPNAAKMRDLVARQLSPADLTAARKLEASYIKKTQQK